MMDKLRRLAKGLFIMAIGFFLGAVVLKVHDRLQPPKIEESSRGSNFIHIGSVGIEEGDGSPVGTLRLKDGWVYLEMPGGKIPLVKSQGGSFKVILRKE